MHSKSARAVILPLCLNGRSLRNTAEPAIIYGLFLFILVFGLVFPVQTRGETVSDQIRQRVDTIMAKMTLEEKIGQMTLFSSSWGTTGPSIDSNFLEYVRQGRCGSIFNAYTASYTRYLQTIAVTQTRLKIPLLFGYDVIHGFRTIFPNPLAEACSWDLDAMTRSARIAAIEAAAEGIHWTFAPMVDIARDPRWGRVAEGAGEDVWWGCQVAKARVKGFQGDDLAAPDTILACAKHFAAYGAPQAGRDYNIVDMSERSLAETYLPTYKACVDAGVRTFMTSFNEIAGRPCTANHALLTDLLRKIWGFTGFIVTDYTAINELISHGVAADEADAGRLAVTAGVDMDMQGAVYLKNLARQVTNGEVPIGIIDDAVRRILTAKAELGLFDDPFRYCDEEREKRVAMAPEHLSEARAMAVRSMVLLKNDRGVLPFSKTLKSLAVIGPLADATTDLLGNWRGAGDGAKVVSIVQSIRERLGNSSVIVLHAKGCDVDGSDRTGFQAALTAAREADAVLLVLGEHENMSGEAASRADIDLPGMQNHLAALVTAAAAGKPVAVVLLNGRPLAISRLSETVPAILEAWFPGTMGGQAIADVLFGDANPSGKLVMTFPRCVGQIPISYDQKNTGRPMDPKNKYTSKYLDVPNTPLYPFGHGLSYTTFRYGLPRLSSREMRLGGEGVKIEVDVTNVGDRDGEEVVQFYIRDLVACITRPLSQMKGARKVAISRGATQTVSFTLKPADLAFPGPDLKPLIEPGEFDIMVGSSSASVQSVRLLLK
ncbi:MAG: glycoside hydrolase family 3 N-terminal domain-containing protein [Candidatus Ozemobacteraceae bacterium]